MCQINDTTYTGCACPIALRLTFSDSIYCNRAQRLCKTLYDRRQSDNFKPCPGCQGRIKEEEKMKKKGRGIESVMLKVCGTKHKPATIIRCGVGREMGSGGDGGVKSKRKERGLGCGLPGFRRKV
jgi:hypothetical protein